ncbi:hypothetical protein COOONC_06800 [Cooperia oncophora]
MLRPLLLIFIIPATYCAPYYSYGNYIPPAYPPPYYSDPVGSYYYSDPMRPALSVPKTKEFLDENPREAFARRVKRQYYYGGYPYGYSNPVGTGSPWANGGGLVGNVISFLVG